MLVNAGFCGIFWHYPIMENSEFAGDIEGITVVAIDTDVLFECAYQVTCNARRMDSDQWYSIDFVIRTDKELTDVGDALPYILQNIPLK